METALSELPDDVESLKKLVVEKARRAHELEATSKQLKEENAALQLKLLEVRTNTKPCSRNFLAPRARSERKKTTTPNRRCSSTKPRPMRKRLQSLKRAFPSNRMSGKSGEENLCLRISSGESSCMNFPKQSGPVLPVGRCGPRSAGSAGRAGIHSGALCGERAYSQEIRSLPVCILFPPHRAGRRASEAYPRFELFEHHDCLFSYVEVCG